MALIKADGSNYETADTYADLADARSYALARGITLTAVDSDLEVNLVKSVGFIDSFRDKFKGVKTNETGLLQFPRTSVYIDGYLQDSDSIPQLIIDAQSQLCIEIHNGIDFEPTLTSGFLVYRQVGPIIRRFSERVATSQKPRMTTFNNLMAQLLRQGNGAASVIRV